MRCAVMQPAYFPWTGYFNLIHAVDLFVFLDDAQYERGSWQNRNRVLVNGKPHWLTVPVLRGHLGESINEVRTDEKLPWRRKHMTLLTQVYGRHPYANDILPLVESHLGDSELDCLGELNIRIITSLCHKLGIGTNSVRASATGITGHRTERLVKLCEHLGCDEYVSPPGALQYLMEDRFCELTSVRLQINEYIAGKYIQAGSADFVGQLSIIDVVANLGWEGAAEYARREARTQLIASVKS